MFNSDHFSVVYKAKNSQVTFEEWKQSGFKNKKHEYKTKLFKVLLWIGYAILSIKYYLKSGLELEYYVEGFSLLKFRIW